MRIHGLLLIPFACCLSIICSVSANADTKTVSTGTELAEMVNDATSSRTVKLADDFEVNITKTISLKENTDSKIIIDGNDKKLVPAKNDMSILTYSGGKSNGGNLEINNLNLKGDSTFINSSAMSLSNYKGIVSLNNDDFLNFPNNALSVNGNINIKNSSFKNNSRTSSGYSGAAIFAEQYKKEMNIENSLFINNKTLSSTLNSGSAGFGGQGGAISSNNATGATYNLKNNYFKGNSAVEDSSDSVNADGGAIGLFNIQPGTKVNLDSNSFSQNVAGDDGGAVFIQTINNYKEGIVFKNNTFFENYAKSVFPSRGSGGAVQIFANGGRSTSYKPNPLFLNNTFFRNTANQNGGAIAATGAAFFNSATGEYLNNIFAGNESKVNSRTNSVSAANFANNQIIKGNYNYDKDERQDSKTNLEQLESVFGNLVGKQASIDNYYPVSNGSNVFAGSHNDKVIIPTMPISPEGEADRHLGTDRLENVTFDQRNLLRADKTTKGSIDMMWVKYDSNGGRFTPGGDLLVDSLDGSKYYDKSSDNDNYYQISQGQIGGEWIQQKIVQGNLISSNSLSAKKEGYVFKGWSEDPNATDANPILEIGSSIDSKNQTLYAVWQKKKNGAGKVVIKYVDQGGVEISPETILPDGVIGQPYQTEPKKIRDYKLYATPDNANGTYSDQLQTVTYVYKKNNDVTPVEQGKVLVKYQDETGKQLKSITLTGKVNDTYVTDKLDFPGYTFKEVHGNVTGTYMIGEQMVTYVYVKDNGGEKPTPIKKGTVVYGLKHIYLYKNMTFNKKERQAFYARKPRINRPMFVVQKVVENANGRKRYLVRDVNHHSKTVGMTGYITTQWDYVRPVYYRTMAKSSTVINPLGVNEYKNKNLTGRVKNLKQGTRLTVKRIVKHNLTTRYQLANGHYLTANRKLVIHGKYITLDGSKRKMPVTVKVTNKHGINLYRTGYFSKKTKVRHYKQGTKLTIRRFEYNHPYSRKQFGIRRYVVKGGYITAHANYVKVIKTK